MSVRASAGACPGEVLYPGIVWISVRFAPLQTPACALTGARKPEGDANPSLAYHNEKAVREVA